jgi:predicted extracellular nuclease
VHFTILPKPGLATGTAIRNHARVVFDTNAPIDTPEWLNTVDASAPSSQVLPLAATQPSASFLVEWAGTDNGAGILDYSVFVSVDGGSFTAFLTNTADTSATFSGELGKTYAFYSITRDLVGNIEDAPAVADALTALTDGTPPEACVGDCDDNGMVAINELVLGVNIALGGQPVNACPAFANSQGMVDIAQLVKGVNKALNGCGLG